MWFDGGADVHAEYWKRDGAEAPVRRHLFGGGIGAAGKQRGVCPPENALSQCLPGPSVYASGRGGRCGIPPFARGSEEGPEGL